MAREQGAFDRIAAARPDLVLFGAGGLGRKVLAALRNAGIMPVAFADNRLANQVVDGLAVLSPSEAAARCGATATFVVTIWASWADTMMELIGSLRSLGCQSVVSFIPLLWKYPNLLPHTQVDLPSRVLNQSEDIKRAFDLWSDEASRREFIAQLRWRLAGDFEALNPPVPDQYWQRDLISFHDRLVFVDAGAFNGDTLAQFVSATNSQFRAAYAFEPDARNLQSLKLRLSGMPEPVRSRIHAFGYAVADKECEISFQGGSGASSTAGSGDETVRCVALDNVLPDAPDLIKYDVEGFELLALSGTRQLIAREKPALVVCAYHLQDHIWRIPLLIHSFNRDYRFYLRPHGQIWETVCYAIPE